MPTIDVSLSVKETGPNANNYSLETDLDGEITLQELLQYTKSALILTSFEALKEEQSKGFDKEPVVIVDGRKGKSILDVSPLGKIEFVSKVDIGAILQDTWSAIQFRSPVDTGLYISSNVVFLNDVQVASDDSSFNTWVNRIANGDVELKDDDVVKFINIQPYARKLERLGVTAQRQHARFSKSRDHRKRSGDKIRAPNGTYYLTYRSIQRLYKRNSSIRFTFTPGTSLGLTNKNANHYFKKKKLLSKARTYLYPTISIRVSEEGIL